MVVTLEAISSPLQFFPKCWVPSTGRRDRGLASAADSNVLTSDQASMSYSSPGPPQQPNTRLRLPPTPPESSGITSWVVPLLAFQSLSLGTGPPCPFPPRLSLPRRPLLRGPTASCYPAPRTAPEKRACPSVGAPPRGSRAQLSGSRGLLSADCCPGQDPPRAPHPELPRAPGSAGGAGRGSLWARRALPAPASRRAEAGWPPRCGSLGPAARLAVGAVSRPAPSGLPPTVRTTPDRRAASVGQKGVPRPLGPGTRRPQARFPNHASPTSSFSGVR